MSAAPTLLGDLQRQVRALEADLRTQSQALPELREWLEEQHAAALGAERTGATYVAWRDEQVTQAAVAWVLGTVFVRFCEDNAFIDRAWLSGPGERAAAAAQARIAYFLEHPTHNDRHWVLAAFEHLHSLPATRPLFDEHNPVWRFPISGDAASELLAFWWRQGADGLVHDLTGWDDRFLGDLYQDLSEPARKHYALLQTPEFVEEFLLDLTLERSLDEYGLEETSLIDPTCGSGHFLLGAFDRLVARWQDSAPGMDTRERVQKALDQVTGVDVNAFAVAIARFRLTLAALHASGLQRLAQAPAFRMRLATGDSLLRWDTGDPLHQGELFTGDGEERREFAYFTEDAEALGRLLARGQYTAAVGNPPYITVKDRVLNGRYRDAYDSCHMQYALSVPFAERFFELVRPRDEGGRAGFVGQITANSFMKREFGRKLIEEFFRNIYSQRPEVELSHVIDTSGAYIPGHGTPTVILAGRRRLPKTATVRAALGVLGEPGAPEDPAKGYVWSAITENIDRPGTDNPYVTIADMPRDSFASHPWSLSGGGASDLLDVLEKAPKRLGQRVDELGRTTVVGEDDAWFHPTTRDVRRRHSDAPTIPIVIGESVRDYTFDDVPVVLWPYEDVQEPTWIPEKHPLPAKLLWPWRTLLRGRVVFGKTFASRGRPWYDHLETYKAKIKTPLSIAFAFVATHNHFVLDRGGKVFNRSAPVIKLSAKASEDKHLELLGLLNSSTACFWLKQVCHDKGSQGVNEGFKSQEWERFYEFTGTKLEEFPLPEQKPLGRTRRMDGLAQELSANRPAAVCEQETPTRQRLDAAKAEHERVCGEMITLQEELDWEVYRLYGLLDDDLTAPPEEVPELNLGERAFEIVLARRMDAGETATEWFNRHGSTAILDIPDHWPPAYWETVRRRIEIIESRQDIALIERPECKRRWSAQPWEKQETEVLRSWLLDYLETERLWHERGRARVLSVARLADLLRADAEFRGVLDLYVGRGDYELATELTKLVTDEAVPFLAAYRYKPEGRRKRAEWAQTWAQQRREDAGEDVGTIQVPPKYKQSDFAKPAYWRNRGKLDVPKERFVLYPHAGRDTDRAMVLGWAGWDVPARAQALATLYLDRQDRDAWPAERLLPLLAGLAELEPWLHQWHNEPDPAYAGSPAAFYTTFVDRQLTQLGHSRTDLENIES